MSTFPRPDHESAAPARLVVVGAASGIGRWLGEHVLSALAWQHVTLLDTAPAIHTLDHRYTAPTALARVDSLGCIADAAGTPVSVAEANTAVCLAVPHNTLADVAAWLLPALAADALVFDLSQDRVRAQETLLAVRPELTMFGVHALFGTTAEDADGQTFVVTPSPSVPRAHTWLAAAIEAMGGSVNELSAERHDQIMGVVQAAAHQALLTFADLIGSSGFDLERDLWANRTPVFELMMALASRVLAPGQEATTASVQLAGQRGRISDAMAEAHHRLATAIARGTDDGLIDHITAVRAPIPGGLFQKIQQAGVLATSAVQSTRARIAEHRRAGELVGIRSIDQGDRLHVGTIEGVTATVVAMRDLLVGPPGRAALLLAGHPLANARRLGLGGKSRTVEFSLGRLRILSPLELETELDAWLAKTSRGCKFLIPESISGSSARRVVESVEHVESAELLSEEVRLGQRECVVRFHARVDRSLSEVERAIQRRIDQVFVWPDGVLLPLTLTDVNGIGFLGPAGTFSDVAARQLARLIHRPDAVRVEFPDFGAAVGALIEGQVTLTVIPITNSSSGLVDLAARVLFDSPTTVRAGGVVDVPVRFDAYVNPGAEINAGDVVLSHPQGFRQCSSFIHAHRLTEVACSSTAEACRQVGLTGQGVALSAPGTGEEFGVVVAQASVGNLAGALTRFLVLGREGIFGIPPRSDVTERSVWVSTEIPTALDGGSRYDEVLRGPSGLHLMVSTRVDRMPVAPGVRYLGTMPWSPRTPLVIV